MTAAISQLFIQGSRRLLALVIDRQDRYASISPAVHGT
jgi:hypothetical protein